jgi:2-polyprenyl-3-methyl-5-hydroxy-6-metoxy-1,4-benzoquinol methylase
MNDEALSRWFEANKNILETAYLAGTHPWQQSGVGLRTPRSAQDWEVLRRPIADCLTSSGTLLDIGCANGYLLECIQTWTQERNLQIVPYGLDISEKLVMLARQRLPQYADHIFVGNAWDWQPPQTFDYVNTTLYYVPDELRETFVHRLLERYVKSEGCLLIAEYLGRNTDGPEIRIDEELKLWGFSLKMVRSSHLEQDALGQTRVAVIRKMASKE